jgi:predicted hotdog family 3-hydroxylacyl-ACP dehydratase
MTMTCPAFTVGDQLEITVHLVYDETPMAVFDCAIRKDKMLVAEARLNVYQP